MSELSDSLVSYPDPSILAHRWIRNLRLTSPDVEHRCPVNPILRRGMESNDLHCNNDCTLLNARVLPLRTVSPNDTRMMVVTAMSFMTSYMMSVTVNITYIVTTILYLASALSVFVTFGSKP